MCHLGSEAYLKGTVLRNAPWRTKSCSLAPSVCRFFSGPVLCEVSYFAPLRPPHHGVLPYHRPKTRKPGDHGMKPGAKETYPLQGWYSWVFCDNDGELNNQKVTSFFCISDFCFSSEDGNVDGSFLKVLTMKNK